MYFDDHAPPHVHVEYQGYEAFVAIEDGQILSSRLPKKAAKLVRDWAADHRPELMENWRRAIALQPLERIPGADND
jgi:hypothetical protein